jgi:hypothetical protein
VPLYYFLDISFPVQFVFELFLDLEVFWVLFGIVFFHDFKPVTRLSNTSWPVFFVPGAKYCTVRNGDLPINMCQFATFSSPDLNIRIVSLQVFGGDKPYLAPVSKFMAYLSQSFSQVRLK